MAREILRVTTGNAGGSEITFDNELRIGRSMSGDGALGGDPEISREHAVFSHSPTGEVQVQDLGSTNGTFVNGQRVNGPRVLAPGDEIQLGSTSLVLASPAPVGAGGLATGGQATAMRSTLPAADGNATRADVPVPPAPAAAAPPPAPPPVGSAPPAPPQVGTAPPAPRPVGTPPPAPPLAGGPPGLAPAQRPPAGRSRSPLPFVLALLALAIGLGAGYLIWSGDDAGAGGLGDVETFSLMAQGFSTETLDEQTGQREINIEMRTFEGDHGIQGLRVHKFLDETKPPPQRTYDAIYTFTATNEDTLVMRAAGDVTEPEGPDKFFGQTHEQWQVVDGTGIFKDARGEGTITTAVHVAGRVDEGGTPTGSNVVKHIEGKLQLAE